ncbi:MAG: sulfite exporter TauE/SafE family protein [Casimicrobiaceae bacterium]
MEPGLLVGYVVLGGIVGFLAGLLGIGGGLTLVPFLTFLFAYQGLPPEHVVHAAVATATATMLFTSVSSAREHHRHGAVLWGVVGALAPGVVLAAMLGPQIVKGLSTPAFAVLFGGFVIVMATQILLDRKPHATRQLPGPVALAGTGAAIGLVSSMVGAGGAFLTVPFLVWCNVRLRAAVSTAAGLGVPISAASTLGFIWAGRDVEGMPPFSIGFIYLPALALIVLASVFTAPAGARLTHRAPVRILRRGFACLLYGLAGAMIYKAART